MCRITFRLIHITAMNRQASNISPIVIPGLFGRCYTPLSQRPEKKLESVNNSDSCESRVVSMGVAGQMNVTLSLKDSSFDHRAP